MACDGQIINFGLIGAGSMLVDKINENEKHGYLIAREEGTWGNTWQREKKGIKFWPSFCLSVFHRSLSLGEGSIGRARLI